MEKETTTSLTMKGTNHVCKSKTSVLWVRQASLLLVHTSSHSAKTNTHTHCFYPEVSLTVLLYFAMFSSPPASLMAVLSTCEELCESILAGVEVGEFAVVQPLSVEYSCILGYLLAWKLLLTFFKSSPSHVSHDRFFFFFPLCQLDFTECVF